MKLQKLNGRYLIGQQELGRGAFATVYPGRDLQTDQLVAIKQINLIKYKDMLDRIDQEIQVHSSLINQHIVKLIDNFEERDNLYIVTELCEFGDLDNFVDKFEKKILPEDVARLFSFQILLGFLALVDQKLIHRDMKLSNILVNKDYECKVADFGFAKSRDDIGQSQAGSPITMAPEVIQLKPYNQQCDVWSFGCIVYAVIHH